MFDVKMMNKGCIYKKPYTWGVFKRLINLMHTTLLEEAFPKSGFKETFKDEDDKAYRMLVRPLYYQGDVYASGLDPIWLQFVQGVLCSEYSDGLSKLLDVDLSNRRVDINFWAYGPDCWLAPHCDKPEKLVSQIFYFRKGWKKRWGGHLNILNSKNSDDIYRSIEPITDHSIVLVQSNRSWHSVEPISPSIGKQRRSVQIIWYKE